MPHRRILAAASAVVLMAAGTAGADAGPAAAQTASSCKANWRLVPTPPLPGGETVNFYPMPGGQDTMTGPNIGGTQVAAADYVDSISAISRDDVMFTGSGDWPVTTPWNLRWDGSALSAVTQPGVPTAPVGQSAPSSFDSDTDGWQLGQVTTAKGFLNAPVLDRWHGGRWSVVSTAIVTALANGGRVNLRAVRSLSPNDAWVVGNAQQGSEFADVEPLVEHWDGTQWTVVPTPPLTHQFGELAALVTVSPTDIWAVGNQHNAGEDSISLAEHWDGKAWHVVQAPAGSKGSVVLTGASATGSADVWASGSQRPNGQPDVPLVEHWDGKAWTEVSLPDIGASDISDVYAAGPGDVWLTGVASYAGSGKPSAFLHWDGKSWTSVPTPTPREWTVSYGFLHMTGTGPDDVWATGFASNLGDLTVTPVIAHLGCS